MACRRAVTRPARRRCCRCWEALATESPERSRQRLHAALALGDKLEQLEAVLIGDRLGDGGELGVEVALGVST